MKMIRNLVFPTVAFALSALLAACGGGGGSTNGTAAAQNAPTTQPASGTPSTTSSGALSTQTGIANSYPAGTFEAAALDILNGYRAQMGVGELRPDVMLNQSAQAHAAYLSSNLAASAISGLSHDEVATNANFYAETPLTRARKAGSPVTEWIGEAINAGSIQTSSLAYGHDCVDGLLDTVYHLNTMTGPQESIGIGFLPASAQEALYVCNFDFGLLTAAIGAPLDNAIPTVGGQQMAVTTIAHAPLTNETTVARTMRTEAPNPTPDFAAPGHPLMVRVRADQAGDTLTVTSFTLTDQSGAVVTGRILIPANAQSGSIASAVIDPNGLLGQGTAFFIPAQPLAANTTYSATFSGSRDGVPVSTSWSFTTAAL
ncbi:CAP domain-containing protein [Caballeronia sordidicola]|uniref:SCP domain-containing protein n=1 Tax=Caballeronia sordidicola TaxID=196367 RepID=A0A242MMF6_CABSO|nr:CAP domain-containing protein [Caballeronia sordidicola]OTP72172.1 hypothetical protein PAMC26577_21670 [Caballeronia sordidicola]